jgi:hypothetical protein
MALGTIMSKLQVLVISCKRPDYLWKTLASLRQDDVELFVVDGGSGSLVQEKIKTIADSTWFSSENLGADRHKNIGIRTFITQPEFLISADDIVYPAGYSTLLMDQYRAINRDGLRWVFMACNFDYIERRGPHPWQMVNGVEVLETDGMQSSCAIVDLATWNAVGGFPEYGMSGQGDHAIGRMIRKLGRKGGYFRKPIIEHLGDFKWRDYPQYAKDFETDENYWYPRAVSGV